MVQKSKFNLFYSIFFRYLVGSDIGFGIMEEKKKNQQQIRFFYFHLKKLKANRSNQSNFGKEAT